ncbi:hypothetical protein PQI07_31665 [Methylobacterium sp. 092160098-2]|uniref:hypothetical protein n=1 Tax=Methylobacterium sp. 092160098-2 TaxID=3025129 RepID=UPI002381CDF8|nr:hypothetical protein [Methylobacterium sp. 092160098-2]MDE4915171.1 hypothetical protein [Methylobacterium sp. 092160098-2]
MLTDKDLPVARAMPTADPPASFAETACRLTVGPATLNGYVPVNHQPGPSGFHSDRNCP